MAIVGLIMILAGIVLGLYVGIWLCLVGGIAQIINELKNLNTPEGVDGLKIAIGFARFFFTGFAGWLSAIILVIPGMSLLKKAAQ